MTIEIKQLVIRAVVERSPRHGEPAKPPPVSEPRRLASPQLSLAVDHDAIVAECTRLVLRELRRERER